MPDVIPTPPDTFANPYLLCPTCQRRVTNTEWPGNVNRPCGHAGGYDDVCPSWSPVDGCTCTAPHRLPGCSSTDLEEIENFRRLHGQPGMTAGEFSVLLPERLRPFYWRTKLDQYFREQGIDPDTEAS